MHSNLHLLPIAIVGALGLLIAIERALALYMVYGFGDAARSLERLRSYVFNDRLSEALAWAETRRRNPLGFVLHQALQRAEGADELIEHQVQISVSQMTRRIQKRLGYLPVLANIATLLGLIGTIVGLVHAFEGLSAAQDAVQQSTLLNSGIATAMSGTLLGLAAAVPLLMIHALLATKANSLVGEMEETALAAIGILKEYSYSASEEAVGSGLAKPPRVPAREVADVA